MRNANAVNQLPLQGSNLDSSDPESVAGSGPTVRLALIQGGKGANAARSTHEKSHDSAPAPFGKVGSSYRRFLEAYALTVMLPRRSC